MLNADEKEELKFNKSYVKKSVIGLFCFYLLSLFMIAVLDHISGSITLKIVLALFVISIIIELLLVRKFHLYYVIILLSFLLCVAMMVCVFSVFFCLVNISIIKWQVMPNLVIFFIALLLFFVPFFYSLRKKDFIDEYTAVP